MEQGFRSALSAVRTATAMLLATTITYGGSAPGAAWAETFVIPDGDVSTLVAAIHAANVNGEDDIIELAADGTYMVDTISSSLAGGSAFPLIEEVDGLTIEGNGAVIRRDPTAAPMRFFFILEGASLLLRNVALEGGFATHHTEGGGAVRVRLDGTLTVERSILHNNEAEFGGAIHTDGFLTITDSEIRDNTSHTDGAAVHGSGLMSENTTFRGNIGPAAIWSTIGVSLTNTTLADNEGHGIHVPESSGNSWLTNVTIHGNGGAGLILNLVDGFGLTTENTVVAQNALTNCFVTGPTFGTNNVADDSSCPSVGGFTEVADALLDVLTDNGGAELPGGDTPQTMVPLKESPLVDAADQDSCDSHILIYDQRNKPRSVDGDVDGISNCDVGATEYQVHTPAGLQVDYTSLGSNGNSVLEVGEEAVVAPIWRYDTAPVESTVDGVIQDFRGPESAIYTPLDALAEYGTPSPDQPYSCDQGDSEDCYVVSVLQLGERPARHWDTTLVEYIYNPEPELATLHEWTLHVGDSFLDVPRNSSFYFAIETALHHGVTSGCTVATHCPTSITARQQMPAFVLRALEGATFSPSACVAGEETFTDVPASSPFCPWIQELAARNVIAGCGNERYCPAEPVSRAQMAVYSLRTLEGGDYTPPPCASGPRRFADVPATHLFCPWIEELARREIVSGCDSTNYCPGSLVTRAQMSVFVTRTFGLELYGP